MGVMMVRNFLELSQNFLYSDVTFFLLRKTDHVTELEGQHRFRNTTSARYSRSVHNFPRNFSEFSLKFPQSRVWTSWKTPLGMKKIRVTVHILFLATEISTVSSESCSNFEIWFSREFFAIRVVNFLFQQKWGDLDLMSSWNYSYVIRIFTQFSQSAHQWQQRLHSTGYVQWIYNGERCTRSSEKTISYKRSWRSKFSLFNNLDGRK